MFSALFSLGGLKRRWPQVTEEEVRRHNTRSSLWIISGGSVYDVTDILYSHPGGDLALLRRGGSGKDCASDFEFHSRHARSQWEARKVGEVALSPPPTTAADSDDEDGDGLSHSSAASTARGGDHSRSGGDGEEEHTEEEHALGWAAPCGGFTATFKAGTPDVCLCACCGRFA